MIRLINIVYLLDGFGLLVSTVVARSLSRSNGGGGFLFFADEFRTFHLDGVLDKGVSGLDSEEIRVISVATKQVGSVVLGLSLGGLLDGGGVENLFAAGSHDLELFALEFCEVKSAFNDGSNGCILADSQSLEVFLNGDGVVNNLRLFRFNDSGDFFNDNLSGFFLVDRTIL